LAELGKDPEAISFYLRLAENWRKLADSREYTEKLDSFLGYIKEDAWAPQLGGLVIFIPILESRLRRGIIARGSVPISNGAKQGAG